MIDVGSPFPPFELPDQTGTIVKLSDLHGTPTVVYFYPKDDTSGCTREACDFQSGLTNVDGARIVGVSPDSVKSHQKFAEKYGLEFTLLADVEKKLCEGCGVWVEKSMYGKKYMGVERTTFLLDSAGVVQAVWRKVKPEGHAAEVYAALAKL